MTCSFEIREYTADGRSPYEEWFNGLDEATAARVNTYIRRLEAGNFGAAKALQAGVFEVRMDFGPGYRVYYGREGPNDHNPARRRDQTKTRRRYYRRRGAMEAIQSNESIG